MLGGACLVMLALVALLPTTALGQAGAGDRPLGLDALRSQLAADPADAESSENSSITFGLEVSRSGAERPTLSLRGNRPSAGTSGTFNVGARVSRVPCPGAYHFEAAQENTRNGNSATYSALIKLSDPDSLPPGARCGVVPPPLPGRIDVSLGAGESELFALGGDRRDAGSFKGTLSFAGVPTCGRAYRLETRLDLTGWNRSVDFRVRVLKANATIQGETVLDERC